MSRVEDADFRGMLSNAMPSYVIPYRKHSASEDCQARLNRHIAPVPDIIHHTDRRCLD